MSRRVRAGVRGSRGAAGLVALGALQGCAGAQSALSGAGREGADVVALFAVMLAGAAAIWLLVMAVAVWGVLRSPAEHTERFAHMLIIVGGVIFPTVVLAMLLVFGLGLLDGRAEAPGGAMRVHVRGEQWWWRVVYELPGGERVVTANDIRLPAGEPVEFVLTADAVIHSFWVPPLGGKMDMIPGRENRLVLTPERPGEYRGACAEFCGTSHALMAFTVGVDEAADFEAWLTTQAAPAAAAQGAEAERGAELFLAAGCAGCHTVRGLAELGAVGPDLTHVGGRPTIAAGTLETTIENLAAWIEAPQRIKPGALMPDYAMLPDADIRAIAVYLAGLK